MIVEQVLVPILPGWYHTDRQITFVEKCGTTVLDERIVPPRQRFKARPRWPYTQLYVLAHVGLARVTRVP